MLNFVLSKGNGSDPNIQYLPTGNNSLHELASFFTDRNPHYHDLYHNNPLGLYFPIPLPRAMAHPKDKLVLIYHPYLPLHEDHTN
jgi:hypothetical protein